jgi:YegS/Rv2252/BmrU family lipid kinase
LLIVNPASRGGANGRTFHRVEPRIRAALGPIDIVWTQSPGHAEELANKAASDVDRVLVAGGDGTAHEVASGLLESGAARRVELGLLPLGTGGDLMRTLDLPRDLDATLARIRSGTTRRIDAARIRYRARDGRDLEGWLVNEISAGFAGVVAAMVDRGGKWLGATGSFLVATVRAILKHPAMAARVSVDGQLRYEGPMVLATASNGRYFGGGMHVAPNAKPDDGILDCIVIPFLSRTELIRKVPTIYSGRHIEVPGVEVFRGRVIELEPISSEVPFEVDGEPLGRLPIQAEAVPDALLIVGAE